MESQFTHKESDYGSQYLTIKEDGGLVVEILFHDQDATAVYIDGYEFPVESPALDSVYVMIFRKHYTLRTIVKRAEDDWPYIKREIEEDAEAQEEVNKYSSGK